MNQKIGSIGPSTQTVKDFRQKLENTCQARGWTTDSEGGDYMFRVRSQRSNMSVLVSVSGAVWLTIHISPRQVSEDGVGIERLPGALITSARTTDPLSVAVEKIAEYFSG